ncbi:hypothetical protein [Actinomadura harenae]|uniref:hypothetical protein n=1 Tax=Actinomadura harenae TaxID=2483351 RepID=UPI001F36F47D|nr:hypothetical protein [Actinomadura harenae]
MKWHYDYVGPAEIRGQVRVGVRGAAITSSGDLEAWLGGLPSGEREEPCTFVIELDGTLMLASRHSEHVACAAGEPVLSAGEVAFVREGGRWLVSEVSNQSTGCCPDVTSWPAVESALERAGLGHPGTFTHPMVFRRCTACHQRNIVKDDFYVCAVCEAPLPRAWNVNQPDEPV